MDLDLHRAGSEAEAMKDLIAAQALDLGDFFAFAIERTDALDELQDGMAVRYHVNATVDGRRFERVTLDVGFNQLFDAEPEMLTGPDLFAFAGITPIQIPTIPIAYHIAERLHAYTRTYGEGRQSSRVKDLIDLVLIAETTELIADPLRLAIDKTFSDRGTQKVPGALPAPPETWATPYRTLAMKTALDPDMHSGHTTAARFLDPILGGAVPDNASWQPTAAVWSGG